MIFRWDDAAGRLGGMMHPYPNTTSLWTTGLGHPLCLSSNRIHDLVWRQDQAELTIACGTCVWSRAVSGLVGFACSQWPLGPQVCFVWPFSAVGKQAWDEKAVELGHKDGRMSTQMASECSGGPGICEASCGCIPASPWLHSATLC